MTKKAKDSFQLAGWEQLHVLKKGTLTLCISKEKVSSKETGYAFSCKELGISNFLLNAKNLKDAELEALTLMSVRCRFLAHLLDEDVAALKAK